MVAATNSLGWIHSGGFKYIATVTTNTKMVGHTEEEYTDYSCSTAIERLSRDVETILRGWHVDRGSDRHVSIRKSTSALSGSSTGNRSSNRTMGVDDNSLIDPEDATSNLIRSNTITWNINVVNPSATHRGTRTSTRTTSVTIDLELALWDAPLDPVLYGEEDNTIDNQDGSLPRSLRRTLFQQMPTHDFLFDNFSFLFGIGQHVSLTPIQPNPIPVPLMDFLGASLVQRHEDTSTAPWMLSSTLSNWLQTALNCAVTNCQCCIPAFGVWGSYQPNTLVLRSQGLLTNMTSSTNGMMQNGDLASITGDNNSGGKHKASNFINNAPNTASTGNQSISNGSNGMLSTITENSDTLLGATILGHGNSGSKSSSSPTISANKGVQVFPKWIQGFRNVHLPSVGLRYRTTAKSNFWNQTYVPPVLSGKLIGGGPTEATMWVSASHHSSSTNNSIATNSRLAVWGSVLLQHCPDSTVVLSGARHVFGWFKPPKPPPSLFFGNLDESDLQRMLEWRREDEEEDQEELDDFKDEFTIYRKLCQAHVLDQLDDIWECHEKMVPLWGGRDDPASSVYATTTWNGRYNEEDGIAESLLTFPLRIRSRRELSKRDWIDMEESVERTILDPLEPSRFCVQAYFDRDATITTLAANQRCVLAALIRSATLPGETLLQHLTDVELVELWDDNAGTIVAGKLADKAKVGNGTRRIVEAMDWSSIMEDMISYRDAEEIVHKVMSGELTSSFPTSPEDSFIDKDLFAPFKKSAPPGRLVSILFAHMAKLRALSSIALVWGIFVQEIRRRWESRESLPNMQYIAGLDPHPLELYGKRCFSTIGIKANFAAYLNCSEPEPDDYHCLIGQKLQVFNIGVECIVAGEILEHETMERFLEAGEVPATADSPPMMENVTIPSRGNDTQPFGQTPEDEEAVIRQREQQVQSDSSHSRKGSKKWPKAKEDRSDSNDDATATTDNETNYGPPAINSDMEFWVMDDPGTASARIDEQGDLADDTGFDYVAPPPNLDALEFLANGGDGSDTGSAGGAKNKKSKKPIVVEGLPDQTWEGTIMEGDDDDAGSVASVATSCTMSQVYYDAAEAGSIFSMKNGFVSLDTIVNVADMRRRPGARCPVQGVNLKLSGDQLYAPYLQRPFPLTDDLVLERRVMLDRVKRSGEKKRTILQRRIDLAQRLQKPKLLSDMSSFKAANPNSTIDDFTKWYGNPGSPLDEYGEDASAEIDCGEAYHETAARKLDKASEAMKVLMATREFWTDTWAAATPAPAAEQLPLFDYASSVEVVIDYLEQMHPANLVNQVMGVNLSTAYFTLISSAGDTLKVAIIEVAFKKLRQKIDLALDTLSRDATGALFHNNDGSTISATSNQYTSEDAIYACEQACNSLSVAETLMARATSLLHKFPRQYDLVQDLLRFADGTTVALVDPQGRSSFLGAIHNQQKQHSTFTSLESLPKPVLREYVFRNVDDDNPCQLAVRFGDEGAYLDRVDNEGGVLLALLKSKTE